MKENREILGRNISGPQPGLQGAGQAARRARRDPRRSAPLALNNLALTYNPQAGTLDTRANIGELVNQIETDPATFLCGIVEQADDPGRRLRPDPGDPAAVPGALRPRQGGDRAGDRFDPTLGGLVAVPR